MKSKHPIFLADTILSKGALRQKQNKSTLLCTAGHGKVLMMLSLIEAGLKTCAFGAVAGYFGKVPNPQNMRTFMEKEYHQICWHCLAFCQTRQGMRSQMNVDSAMSRCIRKAHRVMMFSVENNLHDQNTPKALCLLCIFHRNMGARHDGAKQLTYRTRDTFGSPPRGNEHFAGQRDVSFTAQKSQDREFVTRCAVEAPIDWSHFSKHSDSSPSNADYSRAQSARRSKMGNLSTHFLLGKLVHISLQDDHRTPS